VSPLDAWSDEYLFSAHMAQHLILMLLIPPMLILGFPEWILRKAGEVPWIRKWGRFLTRAISAFIIFNLVLIVWHIPVVYEAALENEGLHISEHLSFLAAGVINWWPIFSTSKDFPPISSGLQIIFLFLEGIPSTILTGIIVFASDVLIPTYAEAPRVFGISAIEDQQIAGLSMGAVSMIYYLAIMTFVFFRWMRLEEQSQQAGGHLTWKEN
jgi:putative membrane protein